MKKAIIIFLSLLLLTGTFASCKKEPDYDTPRFPMIPETKAETEVSEEEDLTSLVKGDFVNTDNGMSISFDGNGSCTMYDDNVPFEGSYSYDGDIIIITDAEGNETSALLTDGNNSFYLSGIDTPFVLANGDSSVSDTSEGSITVDIPDSNTNKAESAVPEAVTIDPALFYGFWQYENENTWIIINEDRTYVYFVLSEDVSLSTFEQDGPYAIELKEDSIYLPEHDITLYPDEGELCDADGNTLYRDEIFDPITSE